MLRYHLYLRSGADSSRLASAGVPRADADRITRSPLPRSVAVCASREEARDRILELRRAGLETFAVSNKALRRFRPEPLHAAMDRDRLVSGQVRMIVLGRLQREEESRVRSRLNGFGLAIMAPAGVSFGPTRLVGEESVTVSREEEAFCVLFREGEAHLLRETEFQYLSFLPEPAASRRQSFLAIVRRARAAHPEALFNDALFRAPQFVPLAGTRVREVGNALLAGVQVFTRKGSTEDRALATAYVLYLTAFAA